MRKDYWLVTTEHLKDRLWFKDEEDFKSGMNFVAITAATMPEVEILAFILMSNHVHFVLKCTQMEASQFINNLKASYSKYFNQRHLSKGLLRYNKSDIRQVSPYDEGLEKSIAYVQMNSVSANICLNSSGYLWGTGNCFFSDNIHSGFLVENLSKRALMRMIHSKVQLPNGYAASDKGYILPSSYVKVQLVESIFKTPRRMMYFLQNSSKAKRNADLPSMPSFRDQSVASGLTDLCISVFGKKNITELNTEQISEVLKQLRYRFAADPNQIARVTGITYENVSKLLDM